MRDILVGAGQFSDISTSNIVVVGKRDFGCTCAGFWTAA